MRYSLRGQTLVALVWLFLIVLVAWPLVYWTITAP